MIKEFGINTSLNTKACKKYGLNYKKVNFTLNSKQKNQFETFFNFKNTGKTLKQKIKNNINFIIKNKTFKGTRHKNKYPVRGQRTRTNGKTKKK